MQGQIAEQQRRFQDVTGQFEQFRTQSAETLAQTEQQFQGLLSQQARSFEQERLGLQESFAQQLNQTRSQLEEQLLRQSQAFTQERTGLLTGFEQQTQAFERQRQGLISERDILAREIEELTGTVATTQEQLTALRGRQDRANVGAIESIQQGTGNLARQQGRQAGRRQRLSLLRSNRGFARTAASNLVR